MEVALLCLAIDRARNIIVYGRGWYRRLRRDLRHGRRNLLYGQQLGTLD